MSEKRNYVCTDHDLCRSEPLCSTSESFFWEVWVLLRHPVSREHAGGPALALGSTCWRCTDRWVFLQGDFLWSPLHFSMKVRDRPRKLEHSGVLDSRVSQATAGGCLLLWSNLENTRKSKRPFYVHITEVSVSQKTLGIEVNGFSHGLLLSVCLFVVSHFHKDQVSHVMLGQHCHKHYPHTGDSRQLATPRLSGSLSWEPVPYLMTGSPVIPALPPEATMTSNPSSSRTHQMPCLSHVIHGAAYQLPTYHSDLVLKSEEAAASHPSP